MRDRGLQADALNTAEVSDRLRKEDGMGVTRCALAAALSQESDVVFLEGMHSWPEIELIKKGASAIIVAFLAPRSLRRDRVISRGRADDSADAFDERDLREISYGASTPIALADEYILNSSTLDNAVNELGAIIQKHTSTA